MSVRPDVRLVCFDWGGVILRICRSFAEGCERAGLDVRLDAEDPDLYSVRRTISARYQVGAIDEKDFFASVAASTRAAYTPEEIARIHDAWLIEEYPGVRELIEELHTLDTVRTGMLSNTNARHWARRDRDFPTAGLLHHPHASHLLGLAKPDERIFRAFERQTGARAPEIVFFDDLPENINAANAAGWRGVLIDHEGDTAAQMRSALGALGLF
ncbi:MAG: HAD family hydrolase [Phycisphaerales bacterium JB059]